MLKLWSLDRSPFNWKVRYVLAEKGIPYECVTPENKNDNPAFAKLNPFKLTPVLELADGRTIWESTVICEYLEETHPTPALLPKDPYERARIRMIEDASDQYLYPVIRALTVARYDFQPPALVPKANVDATAVEEGMKKLHSHLAIFETQLGNRNWFGGDNVSLADASLVGAITGSLVLQGVLPDTAKYPNLASWAGRIRERAAYAASAPKAPWHLQA